MKAETGLLRLFLVIILFFVLYAALIARLFYWQVVKGEELKKVGENQSLEILELVPKRGEVRTSDNYPLATNTITYLAYTNPKVIKDKESYALRIARILEVDFASVSAQLNKDAFWVRIASGLDYETRKEIETQKLFGLGFEEESTRFYPEASLAAHLVGFVGRDNEGNPKGYFGAEGYYDDQLKGRSGRLYAIKDSLGNPILDKARREGKIDGRTIVLTIDRTVQFIAQKRLEEGIEKYKAEGGSIVITDSKTGGILAMASEPTFSPEKYYENEEVRFVNPVVSNLYEPGSTFKVLVMAAALDSKVVKPTTKCSICGGPIQMGDYKIRTWNDKYYPNTTMTETIIRSDNTGMVFTGNRLGRDRMLSYLARFGLVESTGIDLQGEVSSSITDESLQYPIDLATASFGQGISLTPIQLVSAVNSIARDGEYFTPHVVSKIIREDGREIIIKPKKRTETVSESTAKLITSMMVRAVEEGEAQWTRIKNYKIAGKTGTAQIPVAGHYDPNQTIASFVGFFPADNPQITMLVLVNKPTTSIYGSETAAPIFFNIARDLIRYYNLRPDSLK